jgi:hypothetical protein
MTTDPEDGRPVRTSRYGKGLRWRARYRGLDGKERNKSFARKSDAENYLTTIEAAKIAGGYIDPALSRVTVAKWSEMWLSGRAYLKPSSRSLVRGSTPHSRPSDVGQRQALRRLACWRTGVGQ